MRQELAPQAEEDIRLVLRTVDGARDSRRAVLRLRDPGVMAGRHEVGPDLLAVGPELAEFEPDIAHHARVGRAARERTRRRNSP